MFTHSLENQGWLREKWQSLATSVAADRAAADAVWDELIRHYSEPQRVYHNLSHIMLMLRYADKHRNQINNPETVQFAIWFHDVIYDTHLKDNERRSAKWASRAMLAMQVDEHHMRPVLECIEATERHELPLQHAPDLSLFLDMDLAILGAKENIYREYSELIRTEYAWLPIAHYRLGRGKFLQRFLARPALFFTASMGADFEHQARINLETELCELSHIKTA